MDSDGHGEDRHAVADARPVAGVAVRPERRARTRDRDVGAGDDAQRAMKGNGEHATQHGQRTPDVGVLHQVSEVFIGRETEPGRSAIHHSIHGIGGLAAHRGDRSNGGVLPVPRARRCRKPIAVSPLAKVVPLVQQRCERHAGESDQQDAGRAEHKRYPHQGGRSRPLSAAITSHSSSSRGAMAAAPMTVGRVSR